MWSRINKEKVALLIQDNLMTKAGLESIAIAKKNGSWSILDNVANLVVPEDLKTALANQKDASTFFDGLSDSAKKLLLHWITFAKRPETRQKRISELVESASQGLKPKQFR